MSFGSPVRRKRRQTQQNNFVKTNIYKCIQIETNICCRNSLLDDCIEPSTWFHVKRMCTHKICCFFSCILTSTFIYLISVMIHVPFFSWVIRLIHSQNHLCLIWWVRFNVCSQNLIHDRCKHWIRLLVFVVCIQHFSYVNFSCVRCTFLSSSQQRRLLFSASIARIHRQISLWALREIVSNLETIAEQHRRFMFPKCFQYIFFQLKISCGRHSL